MKLTYYAMLPELAVLLLGSATAVCLLGQMGAPIPAGTPGILLVCACYYIMGYKAASAPVYMKNGDGEPEADAAAAAASAV